MTLKSGRGPAQYSIPRKTRQHQPTASRAESAIGGVCTLSVDALNLAFGLFSVANDKDCHAFLLDFLGWLGDSFGFFCDFVLGTGFFLGAADVDPLPFLPLPVLVVLAAETAEAGLVLVFQSDKKTPS